MHSIPLDAWISALESRHTRDLRRQDLLKAARALSVRYVERRGDIGRRSPTDSAGKRAAFATFFAPLHFVVTREIVRGLDLRARPITNLLDLGCGTGAASAAWALELDRNAGILGIDRDRWALEEARWTWRQLGLRGRTKSGDLVREAAAAARDTSRRSSAHRGVIAGWTVNELDSPARTTLLDALMRLAGSGTSVLIVEPIARAVTPWWPEWARRFTDAGGRADEWRFDAALPLALARLSDEAGFRKETLTARSLWIGGTGRT